MDLEVERDRPYRPRMLCSPVRLLLFLSFYYYTSLLVLKLSLSAKDNASNRTTGSRDGWDGAAALLCLLNIAVADINRGVDAKCPWIYRKVV